MNIAYVLRLDLSSVRPWFLYDAGKWDFPSLPRLLERGPWETPALAAAVEPFEDQPLGVPCVVPVALGVADHKRWLTHVLPTGFVRVRHHGWMSGAARKTRLLVRALVCGELDEPKPVLPEPPIPRCPHCGAEMELLAVIQPRAPPDP